MRRPVSTTSVRNSAVTPMIVDPGLCGEDSVDEWEGFQVEEPSELEQRYSIRWD